MKYNRRATNVVAQFIVKMRDDPEYQKNYQKWLREQGLRNERTGGIGGSN